MTNIEQWNRRFLRHGSWKALQIKGPEQNFRFLSAATRRPMVSLLRDDSLQNILGEAPLHTSGSGRHELAEIIASPENPLTARVMVNRVWQHIFGRGIVGSVDNFGTIGDKPTHPELLDFLAQEFVTQGWSIKKTDSVDGAFRDVPPIG